MGRELFRPPHVEITAELRWLLARAFGPAGVRVEGSVDATQTVRLAKTYGLVRRVVARTPSAVLVSELDKGAAMRLVSLQTLGEARSAKLADALPALADAAAAAGSPLALLKYAALLAIGVVTPAGRAARDLDVLVPGDRARTFFDVLQARGLTVASDGARVPPGQLPPLVDASGDVRVEIHTSLLGVTSTRTRTPAMLEDLMKAGALAPASGLAGECFVPTRELIVAHLLVHGIVQHGFSPRSYSLFKMISDLIDLGVGGEAGRELIAGACRWLPDDRWNIDIEAVRDLCAALANGDGALMGQAPPAPAARRLLDHCLAGPVDTSYRRRLKVRRVFHVGTLRGRARTIRRTLRSAVYLSRREIDVHYGVPRSAWGYLGYRLLWPLDVLFRKLPSAALGLFRRQPR